MAHTLLDSGTCASRGRAPGRLSSRGAVCALLSGVAVPSAVGVRSLPEQSVFQSTPAARKFLDACIDRRDRALVAASIRVSHTRRLYVVAVGRSVEIHPSVPPLVSIGSWRSCHRRTFGCPTTAPGIACEKLLLLSDAHHKRTSQPRAEDQVGKRGPLTEAYVPLLRPSSYVPASS